MSTNLLRERCIQHRAALSSGLVCVLLTVAALVVLASPAVADPDESGNQSLYDALQGANKEWEKARSAVVASEQKQATITQQMDATKASLKGLSEQVGQIASIAYQNGAPMQLMIAMSSSDFDHFVDKLSLIDQMSWKNQQAINTHQKARKDLAKQQKKLSTEIAQQKKNEQKMAAARDEAKAAFQAVSGHPSNGYVHSGKPAAQPAPRNGSGSLPGESCSENDPTGGVCITPRTLHAYNEARKVGFDWHTGCYRSASSGEHGKGRACDFASSKNGFTGAATGDNKAYGNRLAAWFVENAQALGVMYVIWYRQWWTPASGWSSYSSDGSPSGAHTNHVHLSMY